MQCRHCKKNIVTSNNYVFHLEYVHGITDHFLCPFGNCNRLFHRKFDFKRHLKLKHIDQIHNKTNESACGSNSSKTTNSNQTEHVSCTVHNISDNVDNNTETRKPFKDIQKIAKQITEKFVSQLYDNLTLNRSTIQSIIMFFQNFLSSVTDCIKQYLQSLQKTTPSNILTELIDVMNILEKTFYSLQSEYKRLKFFETSSCFIKPVEHIVGKEPAEKRSHNQVSMVLKNRLV